MMLDTIVFQTPSVRHYYFKGDSDIEYREYVYDEYAKKWFPLFNCFKSFDEVNFDRLVKGFGYEYVIGNEVRKSMVFDDGTCDGLSGCNLVFKVGDTETFIKAFTTNAAEHIPNDTLITII